VFSIPICWRSLADQHGGAADAGWTGDHPRSDTQSGLDSQTEPDIVLARMAAPESKAMSILVVDDEPIVCDSVKRLLVSDGHQVETTTSAPEALNWVGRASST